MPRDPLGDAVKQCGPARPKRPKAEPIRYLNPADYAKRPRGGISEYTVPLGEMIAARIAAGETLSAICQSAATPNRAIEAQSIRWGDHHAASQ